MRLFLVLVLICHSTNSCLKWRMLFFESEEDLPDKWYCKMNSDPRNKTCKRPQRTEKWYEMHRRIIMDMIEQKIEDVRESVEVDLTDFTETKHDATKEAFVKKDDVLVKMGLLSLFNDDVKEEGTKRKRTPSSVISKIEFVEMLQSDSTDLDIEASHRKAEEEAAMEQTAASLTESSAATATSNHGANLGASAVPNLAIQELNGGVRVSIIPAPEAESSQAGRKTDGGDHESSKTEAGKSKSVVKTEAPACLPPEKENLHAHKKSGASHFEAIELSDSDDD